MPTRASVLKRITAGPTRYADLAGPNKGADREKVRAIVDKLTKAGLIRTTYIDRFPYLVLTDWAPTPEETLAIFMGRARPNVDGCLLWMDYTDKKRGPVSRLTSKTPTSVRRAIWIIKRGPLGREDTVKPGCGNWTCIAYEHLKLATRADAAVGRTLPLLQKKRIAMGRRNSETAKLNIELAREIRADKDSAAVTAKKHGIDKSVVAAIRRNEIWQEYEGGMFTSLIAASA